MAHLFLLVGYSALTIMINVLDILISYRVIKETQDAFFFYIAIGQDAVIILYMLLGLIFVVWVVWGIAQEDVNTFITCFYVFVGLLAVSAGTVVVGLEDIVWRNPGEFIDLTWLFELVLLGYHALKWVIVLSYTISLEELIRRPYSQSPVNAYQFVKVPQYEELQNIQTIEFIQGQEQKKVWAMPIRLPGYMQ